MVPRYKKLKSFFLLLSIASVFLMGSGWVFADPVIDSGRAELISEQIKLLTYRLQQSQAELKKLAHERDSNQVALTTFSHRIKESALTEVRLTIAVAKSNLDSIEIELSESEQTMARLEKESQEIENQLNVATIFGNKIIHLALLDEANLKSELAYQHTLLMLEKQRYTDLNTLQLLATQILQHHKTKYKILEERLKSQTTLRLKEQQAKSELVFQQEQATWLNKLNQLNDQLVLSDKRQDKDQHEKLAADIFYANEKVNFSYLQMLVARYQDQIQGISDSLSRGGNSVTLLNALSEQMQLLTRQLNRVSDLLKARQVILEKRKQYHLLTRQELDHYVNQVQQLKDQYQSSLTEVSHLNDALSELHLTLQKALQQELSSRQTLPGLDAKAWLDLGASIVLLPNLAFHVIKSLLSTMNDTILSFGYGMWVSLGVLQGLWILSFYIVRRLLVQAGAKLVDHEFGHVSLKWLSNQLLKRHLIDLAVIGNIIGLLTVCRMPSQSYEFVMRLSIVWLSVKMIITLAKLYLVETVHDRNGADVALYRRLEWFFIVGGVTTALAVFVQGLPVSYEIKDIFSRLFLLFLLLISLLLLRSWEVVPGLITPHIDERRTYLIRTIRFLGLFVPTVLLINAVLGLCGYVNLVYQISWYEGVFLFAMVGYLLLRGVLIELMEWVSKLMIAHVPNGWLWTEAFLKPIDRVLRIALFLAAWAWIFILYGWDKQSPVVERLSKLIHYRFGEVLNTVVTPLSMIELVVILSLLYWAQRWTREFIYRLLASRTHDLGIRNSIAILSQYTMILVGILIGLRVLGVDFKALAVVVGAFAVTAGFGLRDFVNNIVSGFLLLIERPVKVGDLVSVDGQDGEVIHIGSRAVTMRTFDHVEFIIPNADLCNKTFINYTAKDNIARLTVHTKINQTSSALHVKNIIDEVLLTHCPIVLKEPKPEALLKYLTDGTIEFIIFFYVNVRLMKSFAASRSEVLLAIWNEFEKHGIQPAFPKRELHIKENAEKNSEARADLAFSEE